MTDDGLARRGPRAGSTSGGPLPALRQFTLDLAIHLPAPPPRVWSALTLDIDRWWNYRLRERARCIIEPEVGGRWVQAWDSGGALFGTFTVWDPPHLLVVTGQLAMTGPAHNVLELRLAGAGGGTEVTVRHDAFGRFDADAGAIYEAGWRELLGVSLRRHLGGG